MADRQRRQRQQAVLGAQQAVAVEVPCEVCQHLREAWGGVPHLTLDSPLVYATPLAVTGGVPHAVLLIMLRMRISPVTATTIITRDTGDRPDSISTMEKTHRLPISVMIKERRLRWLGHAARRSDNNMVKQLLFATRIPGHVEPVGRPCGTWMHYAMRDVKDMGQQMGYRSLEWNWPKEAMNRPIGAGIVDGAKLF